MVKGCRGHPPFLHIQLYGGQIRAAYAKRTAARLEAEFNLPSIPTLPCLHDGNGHRYRTCATGGLDIFAIGFVWEDDPPSIGRHLGTQVIESKVGILMFQETLPIKIFLNIGKDIKGLCVDPLEIKVRI